MNTLLHNLRKRNFEAEYFETKEEALSYMLHSIEDGTSISWGGSITLEQIGIFEALKNKNVNLIDRDTANTAEERRQLMVNALGCDYYLMSSNAITKDGKLVNIDGLGNRMSAFIFGPKKVFVVVGKNKIADNEEDAIKRIKDIAAPLNVKRLNKKTPCAEKGTCQDCLSNDCICSHTVISRRSGVKQRIYVLIVDEELGY